MCYTVSFMACLWTLAGMFLLVALLGGRERGWERGRGRVGGREGVVCVVSLWIVDQ